MTPGRASSANARMWPRASILANFVKVKRRLNLSPPHFENRARCGQFSLRAWRSGGSLQWPAVTFPDWCAHSRARCGLQRREGSRGRPAAAAPSLDQPDEVVELGNGWYCAATSAMSTTRRRATSDSACRALLPLDGERLERTVIPRRRHRLPAHELAARRTQRSTIISGPNSAARGRTRPMRSALSATRRTSNRPPMPPERLCRTSATGPA